MHVSMKPTVRYSALGLGFTVRYSALGLGVTTCISLKGSVLWSIVPPHAVDYQGEKPLDLLGEATTCLKGRGREILHRREAGLGFFLCCLAA